MRVANQAEGGEQQQHQAQCAQRHNENDANLGRNVLGETHHVRDFVGQRVDALLKPQNGENNVRKIGHLLNVEHLADGQVDLDAGAHTQSGARFLQKKDGYLAQLLGSDAGWGRSDAYGLHIEVELMLLLRGRRNALDLSAQTVIGQVEVREAQHNGRVCKREEEL